MAKLPQRLTTEESREKIAAMGGTILFEKVLTTSDVNGTGRLVIPKSQAEKHFPPLELPGGMILPLMDTEGKKHNFRFRFWVNNQSRMYLLENSAAVLTKYRLQAGDVLVFSRLPEGQYGVCGRKGTKDDVSRKPPQRRNLAQGGGAGAGGAGAGAKRIRARSGGDSLKSKRMRQKAATQEIQSLLTYWNAYSLPMRKDGVFRAVPNSAAQEGDRVLALFGAWSAIVCLEGELFQAFFDTHDAANAALQAALQAAGKPEGGEAAGGRAGTPSSGAQGPPAEAHMQRQDGAPAATGAAARAAAAAGSGADAAAQLREGAGGEASRASSPGSVAPEPAGPEPHSGVRQRANLTPQPAS